MTILVLIPFFLQKTLGNSYKALILWW